ncbi:MAG: DUF1489 family protein [Alphaproteobacteria bacterium]|nr:DUF1489 family protein [Alphaproteobacteria bacterium]
MIGARQHILGFRAEREENGRGYCLIEVDEVLVPTVARAWRPFQGWRYLPVADAPPDGPWAGELPSDRTLAELQSLGLI